MTLSVGVRAAAISVMALVLSSCQSPDAKTSATTNASHVLADLHLSTQMPAPLLAEQRPAAPTVLAEPIILRSMQPAIPKGSTRRAGSEPGTISLNFEKASLRTVIDAILGDALGVAYNVDERVDGVVTLVSPQKLGREEALEVLDAVLRLNGATLIKGETLYRVVLSANSRQNLPGPRLGTDNPGYAVSVYVPRHTAAGSLQKLIEPLYQIAGALASDSEHNLLLVTGSAEERRSLIEAAQLFDQDWLANQSVGIFPLHSARPKAVADELRNLFASGSPAAGNDVAMIRVSALERLNAVMVVSLQSSGIDRASEWILRLDQTGAGERVLHVYPIHYANVQNVARLLSRLFANGNGGIETGNSALPAGTAGARFTTTTTTQSSGGGNNASLLTPAGVASAPQNGFTPGGGSSAGASPGIGGAMAAGGFGSADHSLSKDDGIEAENGSDQGNGPRIIADPASHALLVMANQAEIRTIDNALAKLDAKPAQILIEATIVEVTLNKNLQYGVQYFLRGTKFGNQKDSSISFNDGTSATIAGIAPGFNGVIGTLANPSAILSALDKVTDSKVLSSPQLLVTDSKEALLKVGTQTPLLTQQSQSTLTSTPQIVQSVEYHDTGVILRVLPRANDADMVTLDIAQEVSQVVANATNSLTPDIDQRRIESTVTVQSGQTVMLGGLIAENNSNGRSGLPPFSSVPWIGGLFGETTDVRSRTELVVFITPHILRDGDQAQRLTEELLGRLKSMRPTPP